MKTQVVIFQGEPMSGKSILLQHYSNYWKYAYKAKVSHYGVWRRTNEFLKNLCAQDCDVTIIEDTSDRDYNDFLDALNNFDGKLPEVIFITTNTLPVLSDLEKYDFVQVYQFAPAVRLFPTNKIELSVVFSQISENIESKKHE